MVTLLCSLLLVLVLFLAVRLYLLQKHLDTTLYTLRSGLDTLRKSHSGIETQVCHLMTSLEIRQRAKQQAANLRVPMAARGAAQADIEERCAAIMSTANARADRFLQEYVLREFNEDTSQRNRNVLDESYDVYCHGADLDAPSELGLCQTKAFDEARQRSGTLSYMLGRLLKNMFVRNS